MDGDLAERYTNPSQQAKEVTEAWFEENAYCPACTADTLERLPRNTPLVDFQCADCDEVFQLKSKKSSFGRRVLDSAWRPMHAAVDAGRAPGFFFLQYRPEVWRVSRLFVVPGHFVTPFVIEQRPPLRPTARRGGHILSNLLLGRIPDAARIPVADDPVVHPSGQVRERWRRFAFVKDARPEARGWLGDVLACVERLGKETFTLSEVYAFERELQDRHATNRHVRDKVRQQLQVLRDRGVLEFLGGGRYRIVLVPQTG